MVTPCGFKKYESDRIQSLLNFKPVDMMLFLLLLT